MSVTLFCEIYSFTFSANPKKLESAADDALQQLMSGGKINL